MAEQQFYIRDRRSVVGNCVTWWRPEGRGYTSELREAGLYEASYGKTLRSTDQMVPKEVAEAAAVMHVRVDRLDDAMEAHRARKP